MITQLLPVTALVLVINRMRMMQQHLAVSSLHPDQSHAERQSDPVHWLRRVRNARRLNGSAAGVDERSVGHLFRLLPANG